VGRTGLVAIAIVAVVLGLIWLRRRLTGRRVSPPDVGH
jgi:hypothetical protein